MPLCFISYFITSALLLQFPIKQRKSPRHRLRLFFVESGNVLLSQVIFWYRQVLCANSFTSLAELSLHRAGKPALNYLVAEDRERVKGGEAACEALDVNSVFCYQPASSSCISMCFMLMYFFRPIGFRRHDAVWRIPASKPNGHQEKYLLRVSCAGSRDSDAQ